MDREKQIITLTLDVAEDELLPVMLVGLHRTLGAMYHTCAGAINLLETSVDLLHVQAEALENPERLNLEELIPALNTINRLHTQLKGFAEGTFEAKRLLDTGELPPKREPIPMPVPEVKGTVLPQAAQASDKRSTKR